MSVLLLVAGTTFAQPTPVLILEEDWEGPIQEFPWDNGGNTWEVYPAGPEPQSPSWWPQDSFPGNNTTLWCAASNDSLTPGYSNYMANMLTLLSWGPFDLPDGAQAGGNVWYWAEIESNQFGGGDPFELLVKQGELSFDPEDWDVLFADNEGGTDGLWLQESFNFAEVTTRDGEVVSYLGMDNLRIALHFQSDFNNPSHLDPPGEYRGVFVDDLQVSYTLPGFDFVMNDVQLVDVAQPDLKLQSLVPGRDVLGRLLFTVHGLGASEVVTHTLYLDNQPVGSFTSSWLAMPEGAEYEIDLPDPINLPGGGTVHVEGVLDVNSEQEETDELNNSDGDLLDYAMPGFIQLTPPENATVPAGGSFLWDFALFAGGFDPAPIGQVWNEVVRPNGTVVGPLDSFPVQFTAWMDLNADQIQTSVPAAAPPGQYLMVVKAGLPGGYHIQDSFPFTVSEAAAQAGGEAGWTVHGLERMVTTVR